MRLLALLLAVGPETGGTVTLPLDEARSLLATKSEPYAPISAAVTGQRLTGQVTFDSLEVTATFQITVLEATRWSRLSLLKLDSQVTLLDATSGDGRPLPVRNEGQLGAQPQRHLHCAPRRAGGAPPSSLAAERDERELPAFLAFHFQEAVAQQPALEEAAHLLADAFG